MDKIQNSFYSQSELKKLGFKRIGKSILISRNAKFYNIQNISLGNHIRIDDFCILSGSITLGDYIHISAYCALYGSHGIIMKNFSGLSPKTMIFSASDDFSGDYLISPLINHENRRIISGEVVVGEYVQIGANSIIMPKVEIGEGAAIGAFSFVNMSVEPWGIYAGIPAKFIKKRNRNLLLCKERFLKKNN